MLIICIYCFKVLLSVRHISRYISALQFHTFLFIIICFFLVWVYNKTVFLTELEVGFSVS